MREDNIRRNSKAARDQGVVIAVGGAVVGTAEVGDFDWKALHAFAPCYLVVLKPPGLACTKAFFLVSSDYVSV